MGRKVMVVQRVVREVSGGISYPILTKSNYSDWALLMKVKLKARALWSAVEHNESDVQEEMMALDALCNAVRWKWFHQSRRWRQRNRHGLPLRP
jgi:hypothetical protein